MSHFNTLMSELLKLFPRHDFHAATKFYDGDRYMKYFSTWQQFLVLFYAQVRGLDSLREIETSLHTQKGKWFHIGLKGVKRSTLSDAMNRRSSAVFEEVFQSLLSECMKFLPARKFRFKNPLYALDSTSIELCLSIFQWAKFRKTKGAIKLHYLYDQRYAMPTFLTISDGKTHDVKVAKTSKGLQFELLPDSIVAMDKAYIDFELLNSLNRRRVYFVSRVKRNMKYKVTGQHETIKHNQVIRDDIIELTGVHTSRKYPDHLRMVGYYDIETDTYYEFLTNIFHLSAKTIADIYGTRWKIEEFFKWIKQNLKIKTFLGTSPDAVMTQIWVAMCYYLLLTFIKFQSRYYGTITLLHRMISAALMDRISLVQLFRITPERLSRARDPVTQMALFDI